MGISGSMVAGVPTGMIVNDWLGWRAVFLCLALAAALVLLLSLLSCPVQDEARMVCHLICRT